MSIERVEYVVVGVNHHTTPVAVRERFAVGTDRRPRALAAMRERRGVDEAVLLSTCNRVEWYLAGRDGDAAAAAGEAWFGGPAPDILRGAEAVGHVFRVAGGLDAMIVGESQILGQVRAAVAAGRAARSVGPHLDALLRAAVAAGRRVRRETGIGRGASIPAAAVAWARRLLGGLDGRRVLVVGAGKMGEATVRAMVDAGARRVLVANRTPDAAQSLAAVFGGSVVPFARVPECLARADVVIVSTGAPEVVLDAAGVGRAMRGRAAPLAIADIAVPRNVDPLVARLPGVHLCDIDGLARSGGDPDSALAGRVRRAEAVIAREVGAFLRARAARGAASSIAAARAAAQEIVDSEWLRARGRLASLTPGEEAAVRSVLRRVVNKLLHRPIAALAAAEADGIAAAGAARIGTADAGQAVRAGERADAGESPRAGPGLDS